MNKFIFFSFFSSVFSCLEALMHHMLSISYIKASAKSMQEDALAEALCQRKIACRACRRGRQGSREEVFGIQKPSRVRGGSGQRQADSD